MPARPVTVRRPGTASLPDLPPKAAPERFGGYELTRKLTTSGVGEIYQAVEIVSGTRGILKRLKPEQAGSAIARRRFEFEMALGRELRHPNLVVVLGSGVINDRPYLFLQEIKGPSMRQLLQGTAPWQATPELLLGALEAIGQALAYAHRAGVVHGDLKPGNVLFETPQKPVVIDFGLAHRIGGAAQDAPPAGYIVGTPLYLPPERLRGEAGMQSTAVDVYALGVMLYEVLAGRPPFVLEGEGSRGEQREWLVERVSAEPPPPMSQFAPDCHPAFEALCRRCLEKKPQHRPGNIGAVAEDIGAILRTGKPVHGGSGGVVQRITRWLLKSGNR